MKVKKIIWQLFPSYMVIILVSLLFITWYSTDSLRKFYQEQTIQDLKSKAYLLENQISPLFSPLNTEKIDELCKKIAGKISLRITVILPSGEVIGDSEEEPSLMNNHKNRPEVLAAFNGETGRSIRFSNTLKEEMVYVAVPIIINQSAAGVIRTSMPFLFLKKSLKEVYFKIILAGLIIASVTALVSYHVSKGISSPLEQLEEGARRFAEGNLKSKLPIFKTREIGNLAKTMNMMAEQLDERIQEITSRNKEQEVVLSTMKEGIIAIDAGEKVIKINKSAAEIFNIDFNEITGKDIKDAVNNADFDHFIEEAVINNKTIEDIIVLREAQERFIQIYSTPIFNEENIRIGSLIVLNEITHIKKLENIRRDFVANVSHELRTPITSIKGFVETILDSEMDDKEEIKTFLKIIGKQANRLNAIIEDLLSISRLEQGGEKTNIILEKTQLKNILQSVIQIGEMKGKAKGIQFNLNCPEDIEIKASQSLFEQALINLLDNAINYSNENSSIELEGARLAGGVVIKVRDNGCGISEEHLPRIFERFYRVDKARSRKMGGTGLGLAIVKHIVQTHGGHIRVESEVGTGTCFYIHMPG